MAKFYYPTPDELQGAQPLDELVWFEQYQPLLVSLANTNEGRDLLCLDSLEAMPYPVVEIHRHHVKYYLGRDGDKDYYLSDFRIGAKWGNVIRSRWLPVKKALDRINLEQLLALPHYTIRDGRKVPVPMGAATTTVSPDAHPETNSVDGHVQWLGAQQAGSDGFSTIRIKDTGTDVAHSGTYAQILIGSGTSHHFQHISRGIAVFYTASIPNADVVSAATFSIVGHYDRRDYSQDVGLVRLSAIASNANIAVGDFYSFGATTANVDMVRLATDIAQTTLGTGAYKDFAFNSTGIAEVSTTAVTRVGVAYSADIENTGDAISQTYNGNSNWNWRTSEYTGTGSDPKLAVVHAAPFVPRAIIF